MERPSNSIKRPDKLSPTSMISLMISVACIVPNIPATEPSTPASEQDGTAPGGGGFGKQAAIAGAARFHRRNLAIKAQQCRRDQGFAKADGGVIHQIARLEIVRTVCDHVILAEKYRQWYLTPAGRAEYRS